MLTIEEIKERVTPICEHYKIDRMWLFGSYAHGYDRVKPEMLWSIMMEKIAAVNMECRRILFELDPTAEADLREELGDIDDAR